MKAWENFGVEYLIDILCIEIENSRLMYTECWLKMESLSIFHTKMYHKMEDIFENIETYSQNSLSKWKEKRNNFQCSQESF